MPSVMVMWMDAAATETIQAEAECSSTDWQSDTLSIKRSSDGMLVSDGAGVKAAATETRRAECCKAHQLTDLDWPPGFSQTVVDLQLMQPLLSKPNERVCGW
jgi:hypothetical protein